MEKHYIYKCETNLQIIINIYEHCLLNLDLFEVQHNIISLLDLLENQHNIF